MLAVTPRPTRRVHSLPLQCVDVMAVWVLRRCDDDVPVNEHSSADAARHKAELQWWHMRALCLLTLAKDAATWLGRSRREPDRRQLLHWVSMCTRDAVGDEWASRWLVRVGGECL
jgi:hypothetical protein